MAANPLSNSNPEVSLPNAATDTVIRLIPNQVVEWQNDTANQIPITIQPVNGRYPLSENQFTVPQKKGAAIGTRQNHALGNLGEFPFSRGASLGSGKIIVQAGKP
jgi:hypothetical protein